VIVLDASVLIAYLDGNDIHHAAAERLLLRADDEFAADPLTLAEVLVAPARAGLLEVARLALSALEVTEVPFPRDTAVRLAQLRADTALKMPDCCVLLAAGDSGASIASFDHRLLQGATDHNLPIVSPDP
jgi:predicted nucleic acid-binding protein